MRDCIKVMSAWSLVWVLFVVGSARGEEAKKKPEVEANSIGLKLVHIPAGEFLMGGSESAEHLCETFAVYERKPEEFNDEYPRHKVRIPVTAG